MPMQILPRTPSWQEQIATGLGTGLATGLGTGLQALASMKFKQLAQQQLAEKMAPFFEKVGIPKEAAYFPPQVQAQLFKEAAAKERMRPILELLQQYAVPEEQEMPTSVQEMPSMTESLEMPPEFSPEESNEMIRKAVLGGNLNLQQLLGIPEEVQPSLLKQARDTDTPLEAITPKGRGEEVRRLEGRKKFTPDEAAQLSAAALTGDPRVYQQALRDIYKMRQREEHEQRRISLEEKKEVSKEQREGYKLNKPEIKEIIGKAEKARENITNLERMEEIEKEDGLDTPRYIEFLKRTGFNIPYLMKPGSQEFNNLVRGFIRDARTYFGARVTNFELDQFLKGIPSLSMSPEGRKRVIANLKRYNRVSLLYNDALKKVISENNGVVPLDLLIKIDDEVGKKIDRISEQFKEDLKKPVPLAKEAIPAAGNVIGITRGVPLSGQKGQKGDKLRNKRTGEVEFIHNGMEWEPV